MARGRRAPSSPARATWRPHPGRKLGDGSGNRPRIYVGVRVGDVYDEERTLDGRRGRVFGWSYRTLEGHVEQGEMAWEVWKFPETGEVLFRVASFSQAAPQGNLLVRIGFRLLGRREQVRFLALTADRMARLTEEQVARRDTLRPDSAWHRLE